MKALTGRRMDYLLSAFLFAFMVHESNYWAAVFCAYAAYLTYMLHLNDDLTEAYKALLDRAVKQLEKML